MEPADRITEPFDGYTELNIFDFDGTLFRSPCPSPKIWDKSSLGRIKGMPGPKQNGLGWFQDTITLSPPVVADPPPADLWIETVVAKVEQSMENKPIEPTASENVRCITVLLTGRSTNYTAIVERMVAHRKLKFDRMGLKPVESSLATMDFKQEFIKTLVRECKPKFVNIFEDREDHVKKFTSFFANHLSPKEIGWKVHDVSHLDGDSFLPREQEMEIVKILMDKYGGGELEIEELVTYTAVVLNEKSKEKLRKRFPTPDGWTPYAHHMTVCLGSLKAALAAKVPGLDGLTVDMLGTHTDLYVEAFGESERAQAVKVKVTNVPSFNKVPHVTLSVAPGCRPVDSNFIREWREWPEKDRIQLSGRLEQVGSGITFKQKPRPQQGKKSNSGGIQVGALVKKHLPDLKGKQIKDAIDDVTQWMNKMVISSEGEVEEYLKSKKSESTK
eukprot:TRINITY_DN14990_c0_g1_i1.p1 TRINITY_DN14990_c0_g1~~TRINITY_DN14990_c0_g1_i1.p1  ORF type:complete len:452 (-),score=98.70 TRINITY_DN14990_c0_g1_i1:39-1370(-)